MHTCMCMLPYTAVQYENVNTCILTFLHACMGVATSSNHSSTYMYALNSGIAIMHTLQCRGTIILIVYHNISAV